MFGAERFCLVRGTAEGGTELNAFDNALLDAGIGDLNLIKVSSIIPPGCRREESLPKFPKGAFVPVVCVAHLGKVPGDTVAAALAVGIGPEGFGVVMEAKAARGSEAEELAREMVKEAFKVRDLKLTKLWALSAEHRVKRTGCALVACVYW
ncbi:MAG: arginine decarboxylase, pyruvoyl-dependent [Candidatus Latescibacterota bacterium]|nr:MAG: arginine decarboxylase, pyruvoyl-dependent [Candidatus Latescibacterota bacterium]